MHLLSDGEGGERRGWSDDEVYLFEGSCEVGANETTNLLCLEVVSIVVTGRLHVCADHDSAFDLVAEPFASTALVQVLHIDWMGCAMSKSYAVVSRQIG